MKKFWLLVFVSLVFGVIGCGSVDAGLDEEQAASAADSGTPPDSGQPAATPAVDQDSDGVIRPADCDDNRSSVHPWATEICDGLDNDCDGVVDEGCVVPQPTPAQTDSDGDGFPNGPEDCAPNNAAIHPGATEICDGLDNDCDGVVDEGCPVQPPPSASTTSVARFEIVYPDSLQRTLNIQVYDNKSDLGTWWDRSVSESDRDVVLELAAVPSDICGFRLNVTEGNPANSWLCMGNGSTASLDPDASISITFRGVVYNKSSLRTWSAPGGTSSGCSAVLVVSSHADCQF